MTDPVGWFERHPGRTIVAIALLFAAAYTASLVLRPKPDGRIVVGDALHHYVQLRSAVFDRDLHFTNEYVRLYRLQGGEPGTEWVYEPTATGHVRNLMPVGPAILWAPAFLIVTAIAWLGSFAGWHYPLDGYGRLFQATAGLTGIAAAALGVWLSFRAAEEVFGRRAAAWAAVVLWLSSSAVYYSVISPTYSHAASLLATSLFWLVFIRSRGDDRPRKYALLGALAGAAALMRWQDAVILVVPAVDLFWRLERGRVTATAVRGAVCVAAALAAFAPQMFVWQTIYGRPLAIPQGEGFMRWTSPALGAVLFSDWHGLFTWTPIVAVAVAGLFLTLSRGSSSPRRRPGGASADLSRRSPEEAKADLSRRRPGGAKADPLLVAAAIAFFTISWYVNAAAADWWAGEAFGSRRFVSCFPVFVLGLAALIVRLQPSRGALAIAGGAVVAHTFLLLVQYQAFMHGLREVAPYPRGAFNLWLARFVVPFDLIAWWSR